jgi:hypothetical protein
MSDLRTSVRDALHPRNNALANESKQKAQNLARIRDNQRTSVLSFYLQMKIDSCNGRIQGDVCRSGMSSTGSSSPY